MTLMIPFFPRFAPFGENVRDKDSAMARTKWLPVVKMALNPGGGWQKLVPGKYTRGRGEIGTTGNAKHEGNPQKSLQKQRVSVCFFPCLTR